MSDFIFSLNAVVPVFLVMLLGFFLRKTGLLNDAFTATANAYVFKCALPVSLFLSIAGMDLAADFDARFCLFCFLGTTVMFFAIWGASYIMMPDKTQVGAFSQAAARSSAAILGVALAVNIYGNAGMVPMMIMAAVPFFNIYSVIILSFSPRADDKSGSAAAPARANAGDIRAAGRLDAVRNACLNVCRNPLIIGIAAGMPFALLGLRLPVILDSALSSVGATATPIALLVMGASFSGSEALTHWKGAVAASCIKLFLLPAVFLPIAALMGFRNSEMIAILIMTGSPSTVAGYVMAKNMHADSVLTSNAVLLSTLLSAVSITLWLFLLRRFGLV